MPFTYLFILGEYFRTFVSGKCKFPKVQENLVIIPALTFERIHSYLILLIICFLTFYCFCDY